MLSQIIQYLQSHDTIVQLFMICAFFSMIVGVCMCVVRLFRGYPPSIGNCPKCGCKVVCTESDSSEEIDI